MLPNTLTRNPSTITSLNLVVHGMFCVAFVVANDLGLMQSGTDHSFPEDSYRANRGLPPLFQLSEVDIEYDFTSDLLEISE